MLVKRSLRWFTIISLLIGSLGSAVRVSASQPRSVQADEVTAFDLILAMNTLRASYGLPPLIEDPIINAVAQSTAEIMAANQMSWHIGDVRGRLAAAGYGGGATVWATENFAVGNLAIDEIMVVWSDASHMLPAVVPAYCNVGAGVAKASNGMTYYILQAAYTSAHACGEYKTPGDYTPQPGGNPNPNPGTGSGGVSQLIVPVKIATPDADGKIFHVVEAGQSFWSIAIAYKITIKDIEIWNNISRNTKLQIGQRLFIPGSNTEGYATPTPVGMIILSAPDQDGKIIHEVQPYQTLSTISQAYGVDIDTILKLNGIQIDWPLQVGQKLVIHPGFVTPSPTPRPLTPIEKLTPASDGKYYHIVHSGETLIWIANLYNVPLADLMAWNGLNSTSIIRPDQKLVLQVTPPASQTPTPAPTRPSPTASPAPPSPTSSPTRTSTIAAPMTSMDASAAGSQISGLWFVPIAMVAGGLVLAGLYFRKRRVGDDPTTQSPDSSTN